jgi:photosystem II stability/assembly factor-like uncharacterized protein
MGAEWAQYFLEGQIDEVTVYSRKLSPPEVTEYYAAGPMHLISGTIHLNGEPLPWIWMEGLPGNPSTNENGEYIAPVLPGWSGTVTPNHGGYYFEPPSLTFEDVTSDKEGENFTAYEREPLWIVTDWLPDGTKNQSYNVTLEASDGTEPYTWSIISGALPNGLDLDSDGTMTGTPGTIIGSPTEAGDFSFTVRVVDSNIPKQAATQSLTLLISAEHQGLWTTTYPSGGNIHSTGLAIDPADSDVIFATAESRGIFKTTDAGASWTNLIDDPDWPFGETDYRIFTIHQGSGNYYMCTGGRIYMSSDRGLNWETIYERDDWDISTLTVDPTSTNIIYVSTWGGEMFKTTDGGANWPACGSGLPSEEITIITVDPNAPSTVYAGTHNSGIFKSSDSGDSWVSINDTFDFHYIQDIEVEPGNPDNIYVLGWASTPGEGVFKSSGGGGSWAKIKDVGISWTPGNCIAIDHNNTDIVYVVSYQSVIKFTNGGGSWTEYPLSSAWTTSIIIDPLDINSQILYAGTRGEGVYKSVDGGETWTAARSGIRALRSPGGCAHSLEIDESNPNYIYAGTINGGYRSLDRGASWENMDFPQWSMTAIRTHPSTAGTVYAVHNGLYTSSDYGRSGTWVEKPFCCVSRMDFGIASDNPLIMYLGARHSDDPQSGVYRSDDGGATWALKNNGFTHTDIQTLVVHPTNHQVVFAGTDRGWPTDPNKDYGLYKTTDGGESWTYISCGLPENMHVNQIVFDPGDSNIMYLVGSGEESCGLYKSDNGGECW